MEKIKILVVDDEEHMRRLMHDMLARRGCEVLLAENGQEAWKIFQKERPQACSIDIHMPYSQINGLELLEKIRSIDKEVYCLMFTCSNSVDLKLRAEGLKANAYYEKTLQGRDFSRLMDKLVSRK